MEIEPNNVKDDIKPIIFSLNGGVAVARFFTALHIVCFLSLVFLRCTGTHHGKNNTKKTAIIT